jgi:hypothetical protein
MTTQLNDEEILRMARRIEMRNALKAHLDAKDMLLDICDKYRSHSTISEKHDVYSNKYYDAVELPYWAAEVPELCELFRKGAQELERALRTMAETIVKEGRVQS